MSITWPVALVPCCSVWLSCVILPCASASACSACLLATTCSVTACSNCCNRWSTCAACSASMARNNQVEKHQNHTATMLHEYVSLRLILTKTSVMKGSSVTAENARGLKACCTAMSTLYTALFSTLQLRTSPRWLAECVIHGPPSKFKFKTSAFNSHQLTPIDFSQPCSSRHSTARNADGCRPSRHPIFSVFECLRSTSALTALVPMSAVLCSPFLFSVRLSPESTRS